MFPLMNKSNADENKMLEGPDLPEYFRNLNSAVITDKIGPTITENIV